VNPTQSVSFVDSIQNIYLLMYGDFQGSYTSYNVAEWLLFILATIVIPLIMLNLLIAIMSDTYERVTTGMVEADGKELNSLILEQESIMFWNKNVDEKSHLHWVVQTDSSTGGQWQGRIKALQTMMAGGNKQAVSDT
jgi:hypothetical protein